MTDKTQQQVQQRVNQALDAELAQMDELTLSKIKAARLKALELGQHKPWWRKFSFSQGIVATSFSLFMVFILVKPMQPSSTITAVTERQLMAAMNPVLSEDTEMLEQLEFVAWLEQEAFLENGSEI